MRRKKRMITIRTDSGDGVKARRLAIIENKGKPVAVSTVLRVEEYGLWTGESDYHFYRNTTLGTPED